MAPRRGESGHRRRAQLLLLVPFVALLVVPLYAREEPSLLGFPFFYSYQLAWSVITIALMAIVLRLMRADRRAEAAPAPAAGSRALRRCRTRRAPRSRGRCGRGLPRAVRARHGARLRRRPLASGDLSQLDEWGLAGRRFGGVTTWFLLGADIFTAYTFLLVPAVLFDRGAYAFFALPYTIFVFPLMFVVMPRLWSVCHRHGYVTSADLVRGRFGSRTLALVVALTGLLATMPYIAVQLKGLELVLDAMGAPGPTELPLIVAFAMLAAYTYHSGLRAPALIGIVKDVLIFVTVLVITIHVSSNLGGFGEIFGAAREQLPGQKVSGRIDPVLVPTDAYAQQAYVTLAFGSAFALLLYPHIITAVLSARSADVVRRVSVALPVYALVLGLVALMGYMAFAAEILPRRRTTSSCPTC